MGKDGREHFQVSFSSDVQALTLSAVYVTSKCLQANIPTISDLKKLQQQGYSGWVRTKHGPPFWTGPMNPGYGSPGPTHPILFYSPKK